jgi:hypothetical protein
MKRYEYVGPEEVRLAAREEAPGVVIRSPADVMAWVHAHEADGDAYGLGATFVVELDGYLRIASRRSEHVACAGGRSVLAAGEMFFSTDRPPVVVAVSNLSTGYCPEPESWAAVDAALLLAGIEHPEEYTDAFVFRRCPSCGERNLVKDDCPSRVDP